MRSFIQLVLSLLLDMVNPIEVGSPVVVKNGFYKGIEGRVSEIVAVIPHAYKVECRVRDLETDQYLTPPVYSDWRFHQRSRIKRLKKAE